MEQIDLELYKKRMEELQKLWEDNEELLTQRHIERKGIGSSQVAALVLLLIKKGLIRD